MNGVDELTNEIIGAAIEVHRTLIISAVSACSAVNMSRQFGPGRVATLGSIHRRDRRERRDERGE